MSIAGIKKSTIGPDHSGAPKRGFFSAKGKPGLPAHHGPSGSTNASFAAPHVGAPKAHLSIPVHSGCRRQAAGGLGHAQGSAPDVADGGMPTGAAHPFAKEASPQLSHGRLAPIAWSSGGASMRNRANDSAHGGATPASGCHTGDPARELSHADPLNENFRGKTSAQDCGD
jgi:hypothetical protein